LEKLFIKLQVKNKTPVIGIDWNSFCNYMLKIKPFFSSKGSGKA
jgi:hypothetical protein